MVFLIVFPSFILKKAAFLIGFNSFFLLFSYSFYLFCLFLMHDGCSFSRTLAGLTIIPFLMLFINQLPIVYCFPVYHSPYIFMFFLNHFHSFLPVSVSFHSSEQIVPLEWTVLFTLVHKPVHWSGTIQIQVGTGQTHYIFYYILVCNFLTILLVINILSFANVDYFPYLYKIY